MCVISEVESEFLPWLMDETEKTLDQRMQARALLDCEWNRNGWSWINMYINNKYIMHVLIVDKHVYKQEPMRAEGPKERPMAVLCVQLSACYV